MISFVTLENLEFCSLYLHYILDDMKEQGYDNSVNMRGQPSTQWCSSKRSRNLIKELSMYHTKLIFIEFNFKLSRKLLY